MQIDWTTFALEIVNFLALLWILKRFLYRPVLDVLARRRAEVERVRAEGEAAKAQAQALRQQYEARLADWEKEKAGLRAAFDAELAAERERQLKALQKSLADERARQAAQESHRQAELQGALEARAIRQAATFAARLLQRLADPALETRLLDLLIEDLAQLPAAQREGLRLAAREASEANAPARVVSAHALSEDSRKRLAAALAERLGTPLPLAFAEDGSLIAGLRIVIGPWQIKADLADELAFFAAGAEGPSAHGG
ncbi:F0F1 ATP synthase subunit delta [Sulfuricystis multivorans]|uniref:F0F1 ATP synthase subunit delta n=1 Tax=Sulfuricystis multivorans TaxID=2211108 RepID=UPI000F8411B0|nr:F0F1 ATP synthase subunit delta [Sulfuricystis multivorans]